MRTVITLCVIAIVTVQPAAAQVADAAGVWRTFAEKLEVGALVRVRLQDGRKFTATLVDAQPGALLLQPRTRVPVPVQPVAYEAIASVERVRGNGLAPGKAVAIGIATGLGAFLATLLIFVAAIDD